MGNFPSPLNCAGFYFYYFLVNRRIVLYDNDMKSGDNKYDHTRIEKKWQTVWGKEKTYQAKDPKTENSTAESGIADKKFYALIEFPYPSGDGLHVGHIRSNTAMDIISRKRRREGYNVLYPIGWDAFGLPTENYAIKTGIEPAVVTKKNTDTFRRQLKSLGFSFDWSREVNTTDPRYYKWTQWIFMQFLKAGLAYKKRMAVNWCPKDLIVLANEEVIDGKCERCGTPVEKREKEQWMLAITKYADKLLEGLTAVDYGDPVTGAAYVMPQFIDKANPHQLGKPIVKRHVAHAIVFDPQTKRYLIIRNKKHGWDTVVIGGIEAGESIVDTARREVREETGYVDLEFKRILGGPTEAQYYTKHKGENRIAIAQAVYFELKAGGHETRLPITDLDDIDKDNEIIWVNEADFVPGKMVNSELPIWLARMSVEVSRSGSDVLCFTQVNDSSAWKEGAPVVERQAIAAIVKHWSEDKYIGLKWKKVDWQTIITGGPEGKQTPEEGAATEIIEETGYLHPKLVRHVGQVDARFFHVPKGVNRYAHFNVMYFELSDGERRELTDEEKANHDVVWLTREEMSDFISPASQKYIWDTLFLGKPNWFAPARQLLDWADYIKEAQRNWIGRSEGAEIDFAVETGKADKNKADKNFQEKIKIFTTRPDTLFGVTYIVLAPEHALVNRIMSSIENKKEVEEYIVAARNKADMFRTDATREKTGVELKGVHATNPSNSESLPIWIADYVLADYGTGAVMAVPAHDERDFEFAKKYKLPMKNVIRQDAKTKIKFVVKSLESDWQEKLKNTKFKYRIMNDSCLEVIIEDNDVAGFLPLGQALMKNGPYYFSVRGNGKLIVFKDKVFDLFSKDGDESAKDHGRTLSIPENEIKWSTAMTDYGILVNSGQFTNKESKLILKEITAFADGHWVTTYKLRDWIFSRQRYWGEPIPVINCAKCGLVPVPDKDLPVELPPVKNYKPTETGESPLAAISKWVNVKCPKCGSKAKRETDTMPNWAGSSWYYLRYTDPKNVHQFATPDKLAYWTPVDWYNGGNEHTTLHLLYSRFWHRFLYDQGLVPTPEPYRKRTSHGLILAKGGEKMSKSKGNVINPDGIVEAVGADALRLYEMFMGPFDQAIAWDENGIVGTRRFIEKVWKLQENVGIMEKIEVKKGGENRVVGKTERLVHATIKKVSEDIEAMHFNTAVSALMILANSLESSAKENTDIDIHHYEILLQLLAPFAPHVCEELWHNLGHKTSIHGEPWPAYDPSKIVDTKMRIAVQINGKSRASFEAGVDEPESAIREKALALDEVRIRVYGKDIKKVIYVKGRLINIVVGE
jgi:leucyl-tRNA synthetase